MPAQFGAILGAQRAALLRRRRRRPAHQVNFLCVHKKLRSKRLAPVLIKEITRRVNVCGIFQAAYTAGIVLPKPVARCRYWHRSLNPKKLIEVGFSRLAARMTMTRTVKLYSLPEVPQTRGLRAMVANDVPQACAALNAHLMKYAIAPQLTEVRATRRAIPGANSSRPCSAIPRNFCAAAAL